MSSALRKYLEKCSECAAGLRIIGVWQDVPYELLQMQAAVKKHDSTTLPKSLAAALWLQAFMKHSFGIERARVNPTGELHA